MKVLLDECVPKALRSMLAGFETYTAQQMGWNTIKNGPLLTLAEQGGFTAFITSDKKLRYQQNLATRPIGIIQLPTNRLSVVRKLGPEVADALKTIRPGDYISIIFPKD
jgi:hypothetical protein